MREAGAGHDRLRHVIQVVRLPKLPSVTVVDGMDFIEVYSDAIVRYVF